ncbi:hypothetical protein TanjilG_02361 [Lupinus angustifolius]|uniref:Tim44-like domain-containing protein n=1 Tax=Lupinus angustifolius TaxID=3871 RepID=A0A4P1RIU9_LUPAN|nr:hypothetical protein TanjilG_02361 [Lupinus angustifolius]
MKEFRGKTEELKEKLQRFVNGGIHRDSNERKNREGLRRDARNRGESRDNEVRRGREFRGIAESRGDIYGGRDDSRGDGVRRRREVPREDEFKGGDFRGELHDENDNTHGNGARRRRELHTEGEFRGGLRGGEEFRAGGQNGNEFRGGLRGGEEFRAGGRTGMSFVVVSAVVRSFKQRFKMGMSSKEVTEAEMTSEKAFTDSPGSTGSSTKQGAGAKQGSHTSPEEEHNQKSESSNASDSLFGKFKSTISSPHVSAAFQKLKEAKLVDVAKRGYGIVKEELSSNPTRRKRVPFTSTGETSTRTELVIVHSKQSWWSKKFDEIKEKVRGHPASKRIVKYSGPVTAKGQEIVEDLRERYETSDNPVIHKIQDEFSLPEFVAEVQEAVKPVLNACIKGDVETLKKYCSPELIERFKAERSAFQSHGIFFDNKIVHISDVELKETKMMGASPVIIVMFQTQQIHCVRDIHGSITEGGKVRVSE